MCMVVSPNREPQYRLKNIIPLSTVTCVWVQVLWHLILADSLLPRPGRSCSRQQLGVVM